MEKVVRTKSVFLPRLLLLRMLSEIIFYCMTMNVVCIHGEEEWESDGGHEKN